MLTHLKITDFGIIDAVELALQPGLTVLTGETGAGKSMIVGATSCLRGGRGRSDWIREGAEEATIEALFDLDSRPDALRLAEELGIPLPNGGELLVRRVLSRAGRGRVYVNGSLCTTAVLGRLMSTVIDISGQHEHQLLAGQSMQRELLDAVALDERKLKRAATLHATLEELGQRLAETELDERQRAERIDFLRFQLQELEEAALVPGEDEQLALELAKMRRASELVDGAASAEQELYGADGALCERIAGWHRRLEELARYDAALSPLVEQLQEARVVLEDAAVSLGQYAQSLDLDPRSLALKEERESLLVRLKRKHGSSVDEILARGAAMAEELAHLSTLDERREDLRAQLAKSRDAARKHAKLLTKARVSAGEQLSSQVTEQLQVLGMTDAEFFVAVPPRLGRQGDPEHLLFSRSGASCRLAADGWDRVEFQVATNAGAEPRPIAKVASGGELSRLMLAMRQVLGRSEPRAISVFDEVDAGVGGATADVIGGSLSEVAQHRQVLVVTHLPQVAAYADTHYHVTKGRAASGPTTTHVERLKDERQVEEIARMLAASRVTKAARENARQLVATARGGLTAGPGTL